MVRGNNSGVPARLAPGNLLKETAPKVDMERGRKISQQRFGQAGYNVSEYPGNSRFGPI
jgi:hypothetical protein